MRFAIALLSILFLWMNAIPCGDEVSGNCDLVVSAHETGGDHHEDACSPFCNCSCCSCFSIPVYNNVESVSPSAITGFSDMLQNDILEISLPIWQPPKLG